MSDDFDDDSFFLDDSFLKEVDNIEAKAQVEPPGISNDVKTTNDQPQLTSAAARRLRAIRAAVAGPSDAASGSSNAGPSRTNKNPGTSRDDLDDGSLPSQSLLSFQNPARAESSSGSLLFRSNRPITNQNPGFIPSSRLGRTTSNGSNNGMFQVHLNFRKENQTTKGKRWDRTIFAESGRRINAERAKAKAKGKSKARTWIGDDDEVMDIEDEEEDDFEPLVPGPKPLVDTNAPYDPQRHTANTSTIDTYIYPTNKPKRDYQWDIIKACFTDNCLVALPTGLGKTFIAGVVMLNFYRWFPTGKIVFLAPTKPLVNQQIEACQMACGIPSRDAAVMTGQSVSAKERAKLWNDRRVFYCTPQTLDNDLKNGSIDPRDIVLAVFDEAHKASGSYAYTTILAYITAQSPYFRVLALTATPGADVPRVQAVVDALHISRIEIREAEAPEISKYMNEKRTEKHFVPMGEVIEGFRDRWAALMRPYVQKLVDKDILAERDLDIKRLKPFRLTAKRMEIARDRNSTLKWCFGSLTAIEKMARAMGHLLEFSIGMFHTTLNEIASGTTASGKKSTSKGNSNAIRNNFEFTKLLRDVEAELNCIRIGQKGKTRADKHPKMVKTLDLLLHHFTEAQEDETVHGVKNDTRAMVFCSFRECVMEVVDMLNDHSGLIRATKFVGQSQGKQEADKGFNQKEQKKTIADFKEGKFNVLVSTSIGEEGLDIGEVDFVVIYDMPKQSIKLLQRIGRTGRKRDGKVHVLMSEGREDANWDKAQETHREIQEEILHSRNLELFEDVERLLPAGKLPNCVEQEMPVDPWDPSDQKLKRKLTFASTKNAADEDIAGPSKKKARGHAIPEGGHEGFKSVAELLRNSEKPTDKPKPVGTYENTGLTKRGKIRTIRAPKAPKKTRAPPRIQSESEEEEEAELKDLEETLNQVAGPSKNQKRKSASARPKTTDKTVTSNKAANTREMKGRKSLADIQFDSDSDNDHQEIEQMRRSRNIAKKRTDDAALDFDRTARAGRKRRLSPLSSPPSSPPIAKFAADITRCKVPTHEIAENDETLVTLAADANAKSVPSKRADTTTTAGKLSPRTAAVAGFSQIADIDLSWDVDDHLDSPLTKMTEPHRIEPRLASTPVPAPSSSRQSDTLVPSCQMQQHIRPRIMGISRPKPTQTKSMLAMPPPPVPSSANAPSSPHPETGPSRMSYDATQTVRIPGARKRIPVLVPSSTEKSPVPQDLPRPGVESDSGSSPMLPTRNRIIRSLDTSSPIRRIKKRRKDIPPENVKEFLDLDVDISGSESSDEPSTDEETESDRLFAGQDFAPTQAIKGYNQRAIYAAGLSTQAAPKAGLQFKPRGDKVAFMAKARKPVLVTDDEMSDNSENEYELGSFVCDDSDVLFDTQSDPLSTR